MVPVMKARSSFTAAFLASSFALLACSSEEPPGSMSPGGGGTGGSAPATGGRPSQPVGGTGGASGSGGSTGGSSGSGGAPAPRVDAGSSRADAGARGPDGGSTADAAPAAGRWTYSKNIVLDTTAAGANVAQDVQKYPLAVQLDSTRIDFAQAQPNGADIRFFDAAGKQLPHAIELWDREAGKAAIWVLLDVVKANTADQAIVMKWGNPTAPDASDSKAVFKRADGFVGVWHLDEDGNTTAGGYKDSSEHEAHGTGVGMIAGSRVDGRIGKASHLDNPTGQNAQQQALEGLDVGFELVSIFALGQDHARQEGAQRRGEPHPVHQHGDADHQGQRGGGEDLPESGPGQRAKERIDEKLPGAHDAQDRGDDHQRLLPAGSSRLGQRDRAGRRQQGQDRQGGDHRQVLEEQDRKRGLAARRLEQPFFAQALHDDGCGGAGQHEAEDEASLPGLSERHRQPQDGRRRHHHLGPSQPQDGAPELPEHAGTELETDEEEHHHHAELGKVHDVLPFPADEPEHEGAQRHPREQVTEHGAQPQSLGDGDHQHGGRQVDERLSQKAPVHQTPPGWMRPSRSALRLSALAARSRSIRSPISALSSR